MQQAFDEIAHPFGGVAFVEPLRRRSALPARDIVAYSEGNNDVEEDVAAATDARNAMNAGTSEGPQESSGDLDEESGAPLPSNDGNEMECSDANNGSSGGGKAKRKRLPNIIKSVRLPNWMDLDQESLPNGSQPLALIDSRRPGVDASAPLPIPKKLDDFGGVGETTVQLRTSRAPAGESSFDEMLSGFVARKEADAQRRKIPPNTYVCHRCNTPGHWIDDCPKAASGAAAASSEPPPGYVCHGCGVSGHWVTACPKRQGRSGGGGGKQPACAPGGKGGASGRHWLELCPRREEYRKGAPPSGYVCVKCNQAGHWVHNCTSAPKGGWKSHSAAEGRSQEVESLVVGPNAREIGDEIAEALEEDAPEVITLLHRCVQAIGEATSRQLLVQTWQVEASGGLLTTDGTNRRRTPGGVFFWLVKQKASSEDRQRIFSRA